jgi:hypothetical protein
MKNQNYLWMIIIAAVVFATAQYGLAQCEEPVVEHLTSGVVNNENIDISGAHAVWQGRESSVSDWEIYYYDGNSVIRVTDNSTDDINPQIKGSSIVWQGRDTNEGDWEIFYYNGGCVVQITNNRYDDESPRISDERIFWEGWDGGRWQILSAGFPTNVLMKVSPKTINLKSKGLAITVSLLMGDTLKAKNVDVSSLRLFGQIPVSKSVLVAGSNKLILKFDRPEIQSLLQVGNNTAITLTGRMKDGALITAADTAKVIQPVKK